MNPFNPRFDHTSFDHTIFSSQSYDPRFLIVSVKDLTKYSFSPFSKFDRIGRSLWSIRVLVRRSSAPVTIFTNDLIWLSDKFYLKHIGYMISDHLNILTIYIIQSWTKDRTNESLNDLSNQTTIVDKKRSRSFLSWKITFSNHLAWSPAWQMLVTNRW